MSREKPREVRSTRSVQADSDLVLESGVAAITTLAGLLRRDVERATAHTGLTQPMAAALGRLGQLPEKSTVGTLARSLGCNMGNLSGTLDRLEEVGYIERVVAQADRRARLIRLTPKGWKMRAQMTRNFQAGRVCTALKRMHVQELEALTEMIGRLNDVARAEASVAASFS
jgi:DNA-binding MarR family transcriptional regulator